MLEVRLDVCHRGTETRRIRMTDRRTHCSPRSFLPRQLLSRLPRAGSSAHTSAQATDPPGSADLPSSTSRRLGSPIFRRHWEAPAFTGAHTIDYSYFDCEIAS